MFHITWCTSIAFLYKTSQERRHIVVSNKIIKSLSNNCYVESRLDSWIVLAWSLKNKELFRIGLLDRPRVDPLKKIPHTGDIESLDQCGS